jgi:disulfide bond formation protein DsbB
MLLDRLPRRLVFALLFAVCAGMMAFGYYLQYVVGLTPCPLCMTQRVFIVLVGLTALCAALHGPARTGQRVYAGIGGLFCLVGSAFSVRHVWLQSLPGDQVPACGPSIDYLLETLPPIEALEVLLRGDGNCAVVDWSFLGLSIPAWTLIAFIGLTTTLLWNGWRANGGTAVKA